MSEPFLGEIRMVSFNFPPKGWAFCNGQFLPINQNQALFALLGTTYGGNGTTTFALPNLQGRTPIHMGNGHILGETAGEENHTLTATEIPAHTHLLGATSSEPTTNAPSPGVMLAQSRGATLYGPASNVQAMASSSLPPIGGSGPHPNMQPYLTISFCIALQGIFPSRN